MKQLKLASSSIRGVVGNGLTPELVTDFSCAFGTWLDGRDVVLARDTRRSSPMFAAAALSGLLSTGCSVINAGICPTPVAQHLVRQRLCGGAIVVTGSHNDSEWNALKFINRDGGLLNPMQGEEVLDIYHLGEFTKAGWDGLGKEIELDGFIDSYLEETVGRLDVKSIRAAKLRVAVDAGNGTAATVIPALLDFLGCEPVVINAEMKGDFAHAPSPTPKNMRQIATLLEHVKADVGFAINSDADSVGIVTEAGEALSEECTFPLVAAHILRDAPPSTVLTNLSTSMMIEDIVSKNKGRLIRSKIGEGNVLFAASNENAPLAGEGSGGVAYLPVVRAFDAFFTLSLLLERMAIEERGVTGLNDQLQRFHMKKGVIPASPDRIYNALEEVRQRFRGEEVNLTDGVRVKWPDRWLHVRASNTEPVLRVIAEGEDEETVDRLFSQMIRLVNTTVHGKS